MRWRMRAGSYQYQPEGDSLLAVADHRRRQRFCSDGCGHEWHRLPLADVAEVE
ncbi:DUF5958 family protein [Streptomyces sp. NPDC001422]|uniref:DUF5958 family protein n=1 Tax=Streptomyces sp. NPDC001422 TaxID=3364575 RepID=UPI003682E808